METKTELFLPTFRPHSTICGTFYVELLLKTSLSDTDGVAARPHRPFFCIYECIAPIA